MRIALFYHSLLSDWDHGAAHFLRGIASELKFRGHDVTVFEPEYAWSRENLLAEQGPAALDDFANFYPGLTSQRYDLETLDLDCALDGMDLVIVHEWNEHDLVARIGRHRATSRTYRLFFHDTHHRSLTDRGDVARYELQHYDGILAFGEVIRELYLAKAWAQHAWTWHEAADTRLFRPIVGLPREGDLLWIGNWGDAERSTELVEFVITPSQELGLRTRAYGVRYPEAVQELLCTVGIEYAGWLPNYRVPLAYARFRVTVHVPRRPYIAVLPVIPTIRPFEVMACGIPLVSAPWQDLEGLFSAGRDYLVARNGKEMTRHLRDLLNDQEMTTEIALNGHQTILERHTCSHRIDELLRICHGLGMNIGLVH